MTTNRDGLILDLDFSLQPVDGKITDNSGNDHHATIHGGVTSVPDPTFGRCVALDGQDGSFLQLEPMTVDYSSGFTVEAFVWYDQFARYSPIINLGSGESKHNILLNSYDVTGRMALEIYNVSERIVHKVTREAVFEIGKWLHIAITIEADGSLMFYKNAQPQLRQPHSGKVPTSEPRVEPYIGKSDWTGEKTLHGKLAMLRTYNRALTPQELWHSYASSRMTTFRASHPVDFKLYDANDNATIYIAGPHNQADQKLNLDIINTSGANLYWGSVDASAQPSATNHHLELRFRKGVLSADTLTRGALSDATHWKLGIPSANAQADRWDSCYLTHTGSDSTFAAGATIPLNLTRFHASGRGGSRGTQVELVAHQLHRSANRRDPALRQTRVHHLNIVNHQGAPSGSGSSGGANPSGGQHIPLHVGFVGSNTILNDGAAHPGEKLKLRFTNSSLTKTISLADPNLKFTLRVPTGDVSDEWALGTADDVRAIQWAVLNQDGTDHAQLSDGTGGQEPLPFWEIEHAKIPTDSRELGPNESFDVELDFSNFSTQHPTGPANLTVHFENIPGYWDSQFVVPIQKSPLLFRGQFAGLNAIPIDTSSELGKVSKGDLRLSGNTYQDQKNLDINSADAKWIRIARSSSEIGQDVTGIFELDCYHSAGQNRVKFAVNVIWNNQKQAQVSIVESSGFRIPLITKVRLLVRDDEVWNRYYLEFQFAGHPNQATARIRSISGEGWELLDPIDGSVPEGYSACELPTGVLFAIRSGQDAGSFTVQRNGNVGIGTANPGQKLVVVGDPSSNNEQDNSLTGGGQIVIKGTAPQLDFIDTDSGHTDWAIHVNTGKMYFIREPWHTANLVITNQGNVGIGTEAPSGKLEVNGNAHISSKSTLEFGTGMSGKQSDAGKIGYQAFSEDSLDIVGAGSDGSNRKIKLWAEGGTYLTGGLYIPDPETNVPVSNEGGGTWDLTVNSEDGRLSREGSSLRYKRNVRFFEEDFYKILTIQPKVYELRSQDPDGPNASDIGYIAEELDQQGLSALVLYDSQGRPDGISYKKICIYLNEVVKEQQAKLVELSERLTNLESAEQAHRNGVVSANGHVE